MFVVYVPTTRICPGFRLNSCRHHELYPLYGCNRACFEVPTNILDAQASTFGEFEHLNNLRTCLLLHIGGSLYNNQFVFYTIIDIIIHFDTITQ